MIPAFANTLVILLAASAAPVAPAACDRIPPDDSLHSVGEFSNMRYTEEHAYGCTVGLWGTDSCLVGYLAVSEGLMGDMPTGFLDSLLFDPKSGGLSFRAKLSLGMRMASGTAKPQRSRDLFRFEGVLRKDRLEGTLARSSPDTPHIAPVHKRIVLRRTLEEEIRAALYTYAEWKLRWKLLLLERSPGW
ncbi:MAG: hypothetical protein ACREOU_05320 [Candidatus Eiseniibacteriota bacterium]